jgi:ABC-2 type transport system permease protein
MNWKHIVLLIRADRKSGRLIRGQKLTKYREKKAFTYLLYGGALTIGLAIGAIVGLVANSLLVNNSDLSMLISTTTLSLFLSLPTIVLIYNLVFTTLQQIQHSGVKISSKVPYWLPITWQEHTLASILSNLLGFPLASIIFISSTILVTSIFLGQILPALATTLAIFASAFIASATTEILRLIQVRFIGAVYRSSGRAAVWVRFLGSLLFFIIFYAIYFYVTSGLGALNFIQTIASTQNSVWFVPFVWLSMTLYSFIEGLLLSGLAFLVLSVLFTAGLFYLALILNKRFGLYEPPAITISKGIYTPKTGFLSRLGFSSIEAAIIRKDFKAFTRRRELIPTFILPIIILIIPIMQSMGITSEPFPATISSLVFALTSILPTAIMVLIMGSIMIGQEGQAVWRIYASPISPKRLVKSKYFFILFFTFLVLTITGIVGFVIYNPTPQIMTVMILESVFIAVALTALSLSNGIRGAEFTEIPRPRMIRLKWSLINIIVCLLAAIAILAPFLPHTISLLIPGLINPFMELYQATTLSTITTAILSVVFYRLAIKSAREFLIKSEA